VGWKGGAVYVLDPVTKAWTTNNPSGGPPANADGVTRGVYNRWQYVPSVNAFVTVVSVDGNVYFYKLTAGMGVEKRVGPAGNSIEVSPNPVRDRVVIRPAASRADVFDIHGRRIAEIHSGVLKTADWPAGVYILRVEINGKVLSRRFLVQK